MNSFYWLHNFSAYSSVKLTKYQILFNVILIQLQGDYTYSLSFYGCTSYIRLSLPVSSNPVSNLQTNLSILWQTCMLSVLILTKQVFFRQLYFDIWCQKNGMTPICKSRKFQFENLNNTLNVKFNVRINRNINGLLYKIVNEQSQLL